MTSNVIIYDVELDNGDVSNTEMTFAQLDNAETVQSENNSNILKNDDNDDNNISDNNISDSNNSKIEDIICCTFINQKRKTRPIPTPSTASGILLLTGWKNAYRNENEIKNKNENENENKNLIENDDEEENIKTKKNPRIYNFSGQKTSTSTSFPVSPVNSKRMDTKSIENKLSSIPSWQDFRICYFCHSNNNDEEYDSESEDMTNNEMDEKIKNEINDEIIHEITPDVYSNNQNVHDYDEKINKIIFDSTDVNNTGICMSVAGVREEETNDTNMVITDSIGVPTASQESVLEDDEKKIEEETENVGEKMIEKKEEQYQKLNERLDHLYPWNLP